MTISSSKRSLGLIYVQSFVSSLAETFICASLVKLCPMYDICFVVKGNIGVLKCELYCKNHFKQNVDLFFLKLCMSKYIVLIYQEYHRIYANG